MLEVEAKAVFDPSLHAVRFNGWNGINVRLKGTNRLTIASHVGVIYVAEKSQNRGAVLVQSRTQFQLNVFGACASKIEVELWTVGHLRHQHFAEAECPVCVLIFGDCAKGIAASVG